jgi:hypothetical protein
MAARKPVSAAPSMMAERLLDHVEGDDTPGANAAESRPPLHNHAVKLGARSVAHC